ncbi:hypothetical protein [Lactococcus protaetiae]|uniref:Uncharacterized protein n=1 Tax=Lactococcus protaetiae TaxID=2592653 RepID=A0A514ZB61_9LACT|nr:hypothetical protein [Lactococcus protaetiae]MCL2113955.1 hypothetical protein [Streptococcaceae bacterium]QDK71834.1 hypothetical protein FLP15_12460 [Lactococcus protaetiae]
MIKDKKLDKIEAKTAYWYKPSQLEIVIEEMFQNESDRIINDEEDTGYGKLVTSLIAIMMSAVVLLSFVYKIL